MTRRTKGLSGKLALLAGGSLAVLGAPTADADIVSVTGSSFGLSLDATGPASEVSWDVDDDGTTDFSLHNTGAIHLASVEATGTSFNGRGIVGPPGYGNVQALASGFLVGPTLAAYSWKGSGSYRYRNALTSAASPSIGYGFAPNGFTTGSDNFFGFRFESSGGGTLYGWARIAFDVTSPGTVTIVEWAYEDTPDTAIAVGAVPEPASHGLLALALGCATLTSWRRRRDDPSPTS